MGNIRSRVKVGVRDVLVLGPRVAPAGPWLPGATPRVVPAARAGDQPSNFESKTLVLGSDGKVHIPGSKTRKTPGTLRWRGEQEKEG